MPIPIIKGSSDAILQRQQFRFDPNRGETVITDSAGVNPGIMDADANAYAFNGVAYNLIFEKGVGRLSADDATLNNPVDNWELIGDTERKDLFQNPLWSDILSDDEMCIIRDSLGDDIKPSVVFASGQPLAAYAGTVISRAYSRYLAGNQEFENDAYGGGYVLKHTTNVPARWTTNISDFNVGFIYSTPNLLTEVSNGALWAFPIPARLHYKINLLGAIGPSKEYYRWGWKKKRSNEETCANNRVNIVQTYVLELWSLDDYPLF